MKTKVKVIACENTMRGQKLTKDDMLGGISYVPAGVIMKRQLEWESHSENLECSCENDDEEIKLSNRIHGA
jgi:hypothetical protein